MSIRAAPGASRLKQLIAVAKEGSSEKRAALLREVTDVFLASPDRYSASELQHFDAILSKVAENVDITMRQEIAQKLADVKNAPPGLVLQLAHDENSVSEPILQRSRAISEEDLIKVIRQCGQGHMKAITARSIIPRSITNELVERGDKDVLVSLAENRGAEFDDNIMKKMVEHSRSIEELQEPMANRYNLPAQLLTEMYFFVSSPLKREILRRSDMLDPALIDDAIEANRQEILKQAMSETQSDVSSARKFLEDRIRSNTLNESLLKELIETQKSAEFLLAYSHYVGVDTSTTDAIMADRSWESLAIACRAAGLERSTFAKIIFAVQQGESEQNKALRILDLYLKIPQEAAERVMRFWRVRKQPIAKDEKPEKKSIHNIVNRLSAAG